jgi:hypothetical protein
VPFTLSQANEMVARLHRHHKPARGHRFSIGVKDRQFVLRGAAIVGRPKAHMTEQYGIVEVTRLVTDGARNACSALYGACARIAKEMGFERILTFILEGEPGTSLRAVGWKRIQSDGNYCKCEDGCKLCITEGGDWNRPSRGGRRTDQPQCRKQRWGRWLS